MCYSNTSVPTTAAANRCVWFVLVLGFHLFTILRSLPGEKGSHHPEGAIPRPPLAEFGDGARSLAGDTEG